MDINDRLAKSIVELIFLEEQMDDINTTYEESGILKEQIIRKREELKVWLIKRGDLSGKIPHKE